MKRNSIFLAGLAAATSHLIEEESEKSLKAGTDSLKEQARELEGVMLVNDTPVHRVKKATPRPDLTRRGNTLGTTDACGVEYARTQNGGIRRFSERVSKLPRKVRKAIWRKSAI